jgi:hypothetical protein
MMMARTVTGGDSFCYVQPYISRSGHSAGLALIHRGQYPVYDAQLRVKDLSKPDPVTENGGVHWEDLLPGMTTIALGNIAHNSGVRIVERLTLPSGDMADFNLFFSARNGAWVENVAFRKIHGQWTYAYRVFVPQAQGDVILRWAKDEGFPADRLPWLVGPEQQLPNTALEPAARDGEKRRGSARGR